MVEALERIAYITERYALLSSASEVRTIATAALAKAKKS